MVGYSSPNNTVIVGSVGGTGATLPGIVDSHGNVWSITQAGQVAVNGVPDQTTNRVTALAYVNGVVWQENSVGAWYGKSSPSQSWYPTYGTSISPILPYVTIPSVLYLDGAVVSYTNAQTPVHYIATVVSDGDRGINFNYTGLDYNHGLINNIEGVLNLNVNGALFNTGIIAMQGGIGGATTNINVAYNSTFQNTASGVIEVNASLYVHNTLSIGVNGSKSSLSNFGVIEASGKGETIGIWTAPSGNPIPTNPFYTPMNNNGVIAVNAGADLFMTASVIGSGTIEATGGSLIFLGGPVASGQTISINASTLEFGPKGSLYNPGMQFQGQIIGESDTSTVLLDGTFGTSEAFHVLSAAGAGLCELQVYAGRALMDDLTFVGHFQQSDFKLQSHLAPTGNWTAISFTPNANVPWIAHS